MKYMPAGSYLPGNSILHRMNEIIKLLCFLACVVWIILTNSFTGYLMLGLVIWVIVVVSRIGAAPAVGSLKGLWLFFLIVFFMNGFFFETEEILWSWWIFRLSVPGMLQGLTVVVRIFYLVILGNVLTATTSPMKLTAAIAALLKPLRFLGVPVDDIAMILSISIQFIPTLLEEAETIRKAQIARGARFDSGSVRDRIAGVASLVIPIFLGAFRRADELSMAMEARGYRKAGDKKYKKK